eukprot:s4239_g2.t1
MPPKAKVALRRPAAVVRRGVRRPAVAPGAHPQPGEVRKLLCDLSMAELSKLEHIWIKNGTYYHREVEVVGKLEGVRVSNGNIFIDLEATGTRDEGLLKALTGKEGRRLSIHVCPPDCNDLLSDEFLVHGRDFERVDPAKERWFTNLVKVAGADEAGEDELAVLRADAERQKKEAEDKGEVSPKEKKAKKRKKEKREAAPPQRKEITKAEESSESLDRDLGRKDLSALFSGTGLDPNPKSRRKILKKARKLGRGKKKKKKRSTSSSSTSGGGSSGSGSSSRGLSGGLFNSERKMKRIWKKHPGSLAATALLEARESLITASGLLFDTEQHGLPPLTTQFVRQHLAQGMSPPMLQEALTISTCLDGLLKGQPAWTADILAQRLKSLESASRGTHWSISRQLELVRSDPQSMMGDEEGLLAARAAREEQRLRSSLGQGGDGRGTSKGKKGKDTKGAGKTGADDNNRGKGGGGKRESKTEWQKKEK